MPDDGCTKCVIDTGHVRAIAAFLVATADNLDNVIQRIGTANLTDAEKLAYQSVLQDQCDLKYHVWELTDKWSDKVTEIAKAHDVLYKLKGHP